MSTETAQDDLRGYRGISREVLARDGIRVWSEVRAKTKQGQFEGLVLPRSETADELHIVLKLDSGYNIGLAADQIESLEEVGRREAQYKIPEKKFPYSAGKPRVKLFGTGGTIASRLDYRTGAVIPAFSPGELYGSVPELADICNLETEKLYGIFSENMGPEQWIGVAQACAAEIEKGIDGIVIGHGTDTMHHTAAALSFMLQNPPVPIVMVGSQRSSDRPSSDATLNLIHATYTAARSDIAEIVVCMFGPTSDDYGLLHRGTRVRKMHSSYRSTFRTIGDRPLATVEREKITILNPGYHQRCPRGESNLALNAAFDDRVSLVYYYPGMKPDVIESLVDNGYRGIVFAGTGLGHVNRAVYPAIEKAREAGVASYMTVQTIWGYTQMYVYETGREIMGLGVEPIANMLPEVAYVKLGWALGQTDDLGEIKKIMQTPINGDITEREPPDGYLVYQGGLPEIEEFMRRVHR